MDVESLTTSKWNVSTRLDGEVLAIWAGSEDLQLGVFATQDGFSASELEGWLSDLIGVAHESSRNDTTPRAIPALLHHALTGLLFSHAELWERAGGMYFSVALVSVDGLVGIGWVGEADIQIQVDGVPQEVDWMRVRDSEDREARAASFDGIEPLRLWVSWNPGMDPDSGVAVNAEWDPSAARPGANLLLDETPLVELTAADLAPMTDEYAPVTDEPEEELEDETAQEFEEEPAQEFEDQAAEEPGEEAAQEPEDLGIQSSAEFIRGAFLTPPKPRQPSSIAKVYDLDRYGETPFEDALEVAPKPAADTPEISEQPPAAKPRAAWEGAIEGLIASAQPAGARTDEVDEALAEAPVDELAEAPVDELAEAPVDELAEAPVDELAEAPVDELAEAPVDELAEAPVDEPAEPEADAEVQPHAAPATSEPEPSQAPAAPAEESEAAPPDEAPKPARRAGMWGRVSGMWQKKPKRAPDLELEGGEEAETARRSEEPTAEEPEADAPKRAREAPPQLPSSEPRKVAPSVTEIPSVPNAETEARGARLPSSPPSEAAPSVTEIPRVPKAGPRPAKLPPVAPEAEARPAQLPAPGPAADPRPATVSPPPLPKSAPKPPGPEREKPASLPEERLAPLVRTSPERPSLRAEPEHDVATPESEPPAPASRPGTIPRRAAAPRSKAAEAPADPNPPQPVPPLDLAAPEPVAEREPVVETASLEASAPVAESEAPSAPTLEAAPPEAAAEIAPVAETAPAPAAEAAPGKSRTPREAKAPAAAPAEAPARAPIRAQWPTEEEMASPFTRWARAIFGLTLVAALFAAGWLLGGLAPSGSAATRKPNPLLQLIEGFAIGGGRYHVSVGSDPDGAAIAVDGKDLARRTPSVIDLKPGAHQVTLSFPDLGSATFGVRGSRDQNVTLHEGLWGRLSIEQDNPDIPISVTVDGRDLGFAPVSMDSVSPGAHEVRFSGPGMTPWAQTVAVKIREAARIVAHPMMSPATGVISVRATLNDAAGSAPLAGGEVWLDGELVGRTPLTLELPRGPHSVKVVYGQESAPVQVIELPGGNQRFASFQLGTGGPDLRLVPVSVVTRVLADQPALVSGGIDGVQVSDVREMWLHVRGPDDNWRRYALNVMKTPTGVVGVSTFPLGVFDDDGVTKYYLSALLITGDEFYTELVTARLVSTPSSPSAN